MTTRRPPDCGELSSASSSILRRWLTAEEMAEVIRRNRTKEYRNKGHCATHDFCDSNQAMLDALAEFGVRLDMSDKMDALINKAWGMAFKNEFPTEETAAKEGSLSQEVLRALDGRPIGERESKALNLCNSAPRLRDRLAHIVEYLRFHTAEADADWDKCLPLHDIVIANAEADLALADKDTL